MRINHNLFKYRFSQDTYKFVPLYWRTSGDYIQLIINELNNKSVIYLLDDSVTFPQLQQRFIFQDWSFTLPKSVDAGQPIVRILGNTQTPIAIDYKFQNKTGKLQNLALRADQKAIYRSLTNRKSVFAVTKQSKSFAEYRENLSVFYLKLQAQGYFRKSGKSLKSEFNQNMKDQILNYIAFENQNDSQVQISNIKQEIQELETKINLIKDQLNSIIHSAQNILRFYKIAGLAIAALHVTSFGYMIFGVQWLGWDIIQPLTFSVSTLYGYLGLRFYRKFQKDRNQNTIRQRFLQLSMNTTQKTRMKMLISRLQQQQNQKKSLLLKLRLAKNKLALQSTLPHQI